MGSPVATYHFLLSFTSYNPDITSDYRQKLEWHKGKASLLGYNQIILYSSLSVFYYPAPGPSFFNTDIQKLNPLITYFPPTASTTSSHLGHHIAIRYNTRNCYNLSHICDTSISVDSPLDNVITNEYKANRWPICDAHISMEPNQHSEHKDTTWQTHRTDNIVCTKSEHNYPRVSHYPIMVISTRDVSAVITACKTSSQHHATSQNRLAKLKQKTQRRHREPRRRRIPYITTKILNLGGRTSRANYPLNYCSMVISTRADYAVNTIIKPRKLHHAHSENRLLDLGETKLVDLETLDEDDLLTITMTTLTTIH